MLAEAAPPGSPRLIRGARSCRGATACIGLRRDGQDRSPKHGRCPAHSRRIWGSPAGSDTVETSTTHAPSGKSSIHAAAGLEKEAAFSDSADAGDRQQPRSAEGHHASSPRSRDPTKEVIERGKLPAACRFVAVCDRDLRQEAVAAAGNGLDGARLEEPPSASRSERSHWTPPPRARARPAPAARPFPRVRRPARSAQRADRMRAP